LKTTVTKLKMKQMIQNM